MTDQDLIKKLNDKSATIAVFGLGYVGLPLVLRFAEIGYKVIGFDIDKQKVDALNNGQSYIQHIKASSVQEARKKGFEATTDFSHLKAADASVICVPTPLNKYREPDLSFITNTVDAMLPHLKKGHVVSLESTTYPGTTDEEVKPRLQSAGFTVGKDMFLIFSPEREDPGNTKYTTHTIPKVCGGVTEKCLKVGLALYGQVIDKVIPMSSTRAAEMTKLLENIHRAVNIGLVNELKIVCDKMGIDIHEVIQAASTKPFGFTPYYPGPGLGGHCIPIDPFYLTWKAREYGVHTRFIELAGEVNSAMPLWVIGKVSDALNNQGKSIKNSRILILGMAYKKNVDDMRESPALEIMELLVERGAEVEYSDPHIPKLPPLRKYKFDLKSVTLSEDTLKLFDCVVLATDHTKFNYDLIKKHSTLIVDTRGVYLEPLPNVVKA